MHTDSETPNATNGRESPSTTALTVEENNTEENSVDVAPETASLLNPTNPSIMSEQLDKYFFGPLALIARSTGAPWMMYANDKTLGLPSIWGPAGMTVANLISAGIEASHRFGWINEEKTKQLQSRILPILFTAVCSFMFAQQVGQLEQGNISETQKHNTHIIMAAIGAFAAPIALYVSGIEDALKKRITILTEADFEIIKKCFFILPALTTFYLVTNLYGVLLLGGDELYQTVKFSAPRLKQASAAITNSVTTFCSTCREQPIGDQPENETNASPQS